MKVVLPHGEHPIVKITATSGDWSTHTYASRPFPAHDIDIGDRDVNAVELTLEPCDRDGKVVGSKAVIKKATVKVAEEQPTVARAYPPKQRRGCKPVQEHVQPEVAQPEPSQSVDAQPEASVVNDDTVGTGISTGTGGWSHEQNSDDMLAVGSAS